MPPTAFSIVKCMGGGHSDVSVHQFLPLTTQYSRSLIFVQVGDHLIFLFVIWSFFTPLSLTSSSGPHRRRSFETLHPTSLAFALNQKLTSCSIRGLVSSGITEVGPPFHSSLEIWTHLSLPVFCRFLIFSSWLPPITLICKFLALARRLSGHFHDPSPFVHVVHVKRS